MRYPRSTVGCSDVRVPHRVLTGYSRVLTGTQHRCDGAATFPYLKSVVMELDVHSLVFCSAPTAAAVRPPVSTLVPPMSASSRPPLSTLVPPTAAVRPLVKTLLPLPRRRSPCRKSATVSVRLREPERACVLCCLRVCVRKRVRACLVARACAYPAAPSQRRNCLLIVRCNGSMSRGDGPVPHAAPCRAGAPPAVEADERPLRARCRAQGHCAKPSPASPAERRQAPPSERAARPCESGEPPMRLARPERPRARRAKGVWPHAACSVAGGEPGGRRGAAGTA